MKSFLTFVLFLFFLSISLFAQEQTLQGSGEISNGGFGAPVIKITQIEGELALLAGVRGGCIINHTLIIGAGGYRLATNIETETPPSIFLPPYPNMGMYMNLAYGGLELEYIIQSDQLLHFSVYTLIGAGAVSLRGQELNDVIHSENEYNYPADEFFVLEPAVNAELNVTSFIRISAGFSYRLITGSGRITLRIATLPDLQEYLRSSSVHSDNSDLDSDTGFQERFQVKADICTEQSQLKNLSCYLISNPVL